MSTSAYLRLELGSGKVHMLLDDQSDQTYVTGADTAGRAYHQTCDGDRFVPEVQSHR